MFFPPSGFLIEILYIFIPLPYALRVPHTADPHSSVKISSLISPVCNAFVCSSLGWRIYSLLLQNTSLVDVVVSQAEVRPSPVMTNNKCISLKNTLGWSAIVSCNGELILSCFIWLDLCISLTLRLLYRDMFFTICVICASFVRHMLSRPELYSWVTMYANKMSNACVENWNIQTTELFQLFELALKQTRCFVICSLRPLNIYGVVWPCGHDFREGQIFLWFTCA
jgi:hypothetical protein